MVSIGYTEQQLMIRDSVTKLCAPFDDQYWLERDTDGVFPHAFCNAFAEAVRLQAKFRF